MNGTLTEQEENLIKDVLLEIGMENLTRRFARACRMDPKQFDEVADSIFKKCGNGRVTFIEDPSDL